MKKYPISPQVSRIFVDPENSDLKNNNLCGKVYRVISLEESDNNMASLFGRDNRQLFEITDFRKDGQVSSFSKIFKDMEIMSKMEFHYDSNNRIEKEIVYNNYGEIIEKTLFRFDSKGRMVEEFRKESDQKYTGKYEDELLVSVNEVSKAQDYNQTYTIDRNSKNQIIEVILNNNVAPPSHIFFEYDHNGNLNKEFYKDKKGEKILKKSREYDLYRNPIKITFHRPSGNSLCHFEYQYDEQNNWTKILVYENGRKSSGTGRRYLYY